MCSIPRIKTNFCSCKNQQMHTCKTIRYYSFHKHVLVTRVANLKVSNTKNTSNTLLITQKMCKKTFQGCYRWTCSFLVVCLTNFCSCKNQQMHTCKTIRYYSFHKHVLVTRVANLKVSNIKNTSNTLLITQKMCKKTFQGCYRWTCSFLVVCLTYSCM
jgi:prolyl-tRNA synthetase